MRGRMVLRHITKKETRHRMKQYILALDEGTTSARSILFDCELRVVSMAQHPIARNTPTPVGWSRIRWRYTPTSTLP